MSSEAVEEKVKAFCRSHKSYDWTGLKWFMMVLQPIEPNQRGFNWFAKWSCEKGTSVHTNYMS